MIFPTCPERSPSRRRASGALGRSGPRATTKGSAHIYSSVRRTPLSYVPRRGVRVPRRARKRLSEFSAVQGAFSDMRALVCARLFGLAKGGSKKTKINPENAVFFWTFGFEKCRVFFGHSDSRNAVFFFHIRIREMPCFFRTFGFENCRVFFGHFFAFLIIEGTFALAQSFPNFRKL